MSVTASSLGPPPPRVASSPRMSSSPRPSASPRRMQKKIKKSTTDTSLVRSKSFPGAKKEVDMLTPKQNGTVDGVDQDSKKASSASIKGMWKKAFKTLKSTEEKPDKDKDKEKDKGKGSGSLIKRSSFTKLRKDSKEKDDVTEGEQEVSHEIDPVYSLLKCAADLPKAGSSGKPCTNTTCSGHKHGIECGGNTSQSSSPSSSAPSSPTDSSSSQSVNRKKLGKRSSSLEIEESKHRSHSPSPRDSPITLSPRSQRKLEKQKEIYVVLYHFRGKEKDDLDLRAGWRISVMDSSDPDWWKGRHNNKTGYFPATYVIRLNPGQRVFQVTHAMHLSEGDNGLRLHKDQIVIQAGEEEHGMIQVMAANKKQAMCPLKYLQEV